MNIEFACQVDMGVRESNDDRALAMGQVMGAGACHGEQSAPAVAAVCDGCGGYAGGGVAAQTVLEVLSQARPEALGQPDRLAEVLAAAEEAVLAKKQEMPQYSEMCTTIAGCVFCEEGTLIFHAGDSRVYRYDGVSLARMTVDHSAVQSMVDTGRMTEEESLRSPQRNIINRCIGIGCEPPEIRASRVSIQPGEIYLMCSDGFWESVQDPQLKRLLSENDDLSALAERLVAQALENGSDDNISVCLCACRGGEKTASAAPFVLD